MATTTALRDRVSSEGGFDSTLWNTAIVEWLSSKHRELVVESRWLFADSYSLGTTTAGTSSYTWPDIAVAFEWIEIDGVRFLLASDDEVDALHEGTSTSSGDGGWYAPSANATGTTKQFRVWPAPETSSLAITGKVALGAADLTIAGSNPLTPDDLNEHLISGAIGLGKSRVEQRPDLAAGYEQHFQEGIVKLRKRRVSRGGTGAVQVRVKGVHF